MHLLLGTISSFLVFQVPWIVACFFFGEGGGGEDVHFSPGFNARRILVCLLGLILLNESLGKKATNLFLIKHFIKNPNQKHLIMDPVKTDVQKDNVKSEEVAQFMAR